MDVNEVGKVRLKDAVFRRILPVSLDALTHRRTDAFYQHPQKSPVFRLWKSGNPNHKRSATLYMPEIRFRSGTPLGELTTLPQTS